MSWRHHSHSDYGRNGQGRIKLLAVFFMIFGALIMIRIFNLQIIQGDIYVALASGQHEIYQRLLPERGSIYVVENQGGQKKLFPLVTNQDLYLLYAVPIIIKEPRQVAEKLVDILGLPEPVEMEKIRASLFADISPDLDFKIAEEIKQIRLQQWGEEQREAEIEKLYQILAKENDPYEPVRGRLTEVQMNEIKDLNIIGLGFSRETWRFYSEPGLGGHIFGFLGFGEDRRRGQYGLEGYFDGILAGQMGEIHSEKDPFGNLIAIGRRAIKEKVDGADLVLTLDRAIQYKTCQSLYAAVERYQAAGGTIVIMNPKTGAILAMCGAPDFNPDQYARVVSLDAYNNPAIFKPYEPGSIFKPITLAAAIDAGKIDPQAIYEDTGQVTIGSHTIKNFANKVYGRQNMTQVLDQSINTGAIYAMRQIGPRLFNKYVKDFGFGSLTGIELQTEVSGDISNLSKSGEIYAATASFGQGISVTPLQMTAAVAAIANNGKLMKPYLVSEIIHQDGEIERIEPREIGQPISSRTAAMVSGMMVSVVESGHGKLAQVPHYRVAGKTGTAQIARTDGRGYDSNEVIVSFVGFAPFNDPRFVMLISLDRPQYGKEAATTAAPIFSDIAKFILQYYNVPHDK